ncbi:MAG: hypothetical protein EBX37_10580 [Alphaproteobacteria bacterium]|nr:hypothetical protein [Alphaproteobacteria bacterium]
MNKIIYLKISFKPKAAMKFCLVVYSHTDYNDILKVQNDFIRKQFNNLHKILFLNRAPDLQLPDLCFDEIKYYDDKLNYSQRLTECLKQIDAEYILFMHDIDAVVHIEPGIIDLLLQTCIDNHMDRLDLYHRNFVHPERDHVIKVNDSFSLVENVSQDCKYNVNPCIYKTSSFLQVMSSIDATYRNVEDLAQPGAHKDWKVYMVYSNFPVHCGWFSCDPMLIFLHLTHYGKMLPVWPQINKMEPTIARFYYEICKTYEFKKKFSLALYEHIAFQDPNYFRSIESILNQPINL